MKVETKRIERKRRPSSRIAEVYYSPDRPGMHDIKADFQWRRSHKPPRVIPQIRDAIMATIVAKFGLNFVDNLEIRYSRHCGCSMCPCSPGWIVKAKGRETFDKIMIWLKD